MFMQHKRKNNKLKYRILAIATEYRHRSEEQKLRIKTDKCWLDIRKLRKDLGFPSEEAALLQLKTDVKIAIEREVARRKLSPKELCRELNVQQPQVSDLLTGKVAKMTIDKLMKYAHRLGMTVELRAKANVKGTSKA